MSWISSLEGMKFRGCNAEKCTYRRVKEANEPMKLPIKTIIDSGDGVDGGADCRGDV